MVYELLEKDLSSIIERTQVKNQKIPEEKIRSYVYQLFRALSHMQRKGFTHRDVKPENLLIRNDDLIKLTDFGIVKDSNDN
jgi:serine/threonine protein kinase